MAKEQRLEGLCNGVGVRQCSGGIAIESHAMNNIEDPARRLASSEQN